MRLYSFQRFLMVILSSSELIYSQELVQFLSLNEVQFARAKKVSQGITIIGRRGADKIDPKA